MLTRLTLILTLAAAAVTAQTGPFQDGELLIHNPNGNDAQLIRVDPTTGNAAVLLEDFFWGGWADSIVYCPHRGAVVASLALPPDAYWQHRPWVVSWDGTTTSIPGIFAERLSAMEAIGDGRIYFQREGFGTTTIEYFDAANQLHVLMDETGLAPAAVEVEHMVYDPVGNALIASSNPWWSTGNCSGTQSNTIYRIPLSPDGSQLAGPVTCTPLVAGSLICMGLTRQPNGNILAVFAGTTTLGFQYPEKIWSIDPTTLSASLYSNSALIDLNGGVYSAQLGRAILLDDTANVLRTHTLGQGGSGTLLPVSLPIGDGTTGFSPASDMTILDVSGPSCVGYSTTFGVGLEGSGGLVPTLAGVGCPDLGSPWSLAVTQALGGAFGYLFVGTSVNAVPLKGGTFYVGGLALSLPVVTSGTPGFAGAGELNLPAMITDPTLAGVELVFQAGFVDPGALANATLTNALRVAGW